MIGQRKERSLPVMGCGDIFKLLIHSQWFFSSKESLLTFTRVGYYVRNIYGQIEINEMKAGQQPYCLNVLHYYMYAMKNCIDDFFA